PRKASAWLGRFEEARCEGMTIDECYEGGAVELPEDISIEKAEFSYQMKLHGSPAHAVEVEMELLDEAGAPIYAPFRFGLVLPAGEKPFSSPVEMALRGSVNLSLSAVVEALKRAHSVRVRDVRAWPRPVEKAAIWAE